MAEPESVVSRELRSVGSDEFLANERGQSRSHTQLLGCEGLDGAAVEDLALDRAPLEHHALFGLELVEPGCEQRLDRRRDDHVGVRAEPSIATISSTKSGFPPAARRIRPRRSVVDLPAGEPLLDQQLAVLLRQRLELKAHRPAGTAVEQLRPRAAEQKDRGPAREQGDVLDEFEEGLLSPLDVVEDDDERGGRLEQLAEGPGDLFPGRRDVLAEERADRACRLRLDLDAGELLDDLDDRPVGDPLTVGEAAAANGAHAGAGDQLGRQTGLADTGRPQHGDDLAARLLLRAFPGREQRPELLLPADHRGVEPTGGRLARGRHQPEGGDGLGLPFQGERLDRVGLDRVPGEPDRFCPDEHLAGRRRLLQTGGDVDRVPGRQTLLGTGDDLTGVHADPALDPELGQRGSHLERRPAGAQRVVLVRNGHSEHRHHRIADELLHRATVVLDDPLHPLEITGEQTPAASPDRSTRPARSSPTTSQNNTVTTLRCKRRSSRKRQARGRVSDRTWPAVSSTGPAAMNRRPPGCASVQECPLKPSYLLRIETRDGQQVPR